jgi:hypothetical protein
MDMRREQPIPTSDWDSKRLGKARNRLVELLAGVGTGSDHWDSLRMSFQLRRRLSEAEIAQISPAWLAVPAIDEG